MEPAVCTHSSTLVRVVIVFAQVVAVVGGHQRDAELSLHLEAGRMDLLFQLQPLVLYFEEEVPLAENVLVLPGCRFAAS